MDPYKEIQTGNPRKETGWIQISQDHLGMPIKIPYMIIKGKSKGPTTTILSGIHPDELNGQKVIHNLYNQINTQTLKGNLIFFPLVNIPSSHLKQRLFTDGVDLNHVFGSGKGKLPSGTFQQELSKQIIQNTNLVIDLHSERAHIESCCFAFANLKDSTIKKVIPKLNLDLIINSNPSPKTLRGYCQERKIPAITIEIGDANKLQTDKVNQVTKGILSIITSSKIPIKQKPIITKNASWQMSNYGGYATMTAKLKSKVKKGDIIGQVSNVFGQNLATLKAQRDGFIAGIYKYPLIQKGDKLVNIVPLK